MSDAPPVSVEKRRLDTLYPWKYRRAVVMWVIAMCSGIMIYLTGWGTADSRLHETIVYAVAALLMSTIGSYVFGAVWHDSNIMHEGRMNHDVDDARGPRE